MRLHYPYLIIGGGMTADAAVRGIRSVDTERPIGLIGLEPDPPYNRPPLSKGVWKPSRIKGRDPLARIWRHTETLGVDLLLGRAVAQLDGVQNRAIDDRGNEYTYDRLLLATGGDPIQLTPAHDRIIYYRTVADYHHLHQLTRDARRFAVIGGGFIGSEIAAVLNGLGKEVVMIFPESGIGARILPEAISLYLNGFYREKGVEVLAGQLVDSLQAGDQSVVIHTNQPAELRVDAVVAGLGIRPNVTLAQQAGLATGNGIQVDPFLRTTHPEIFAAGDVANFYNSTLNRRMRVEHEENANLTGQFAGQGMAGQLTPYDFLPGVYSTLFDIDYDAVGDLDPRLEIVYDWQEPFHKGVAFYLDQGRVRGVLLWNVPRGLETARQLIAAPGPFLPGDLHGRIS